MVEERKEAVSQTTIDEHAAFTAIKGVAGRLRECQAKVADLEL